MSHSISRRDFLKKTGTTALAAAMAGPLVGMEADAASGKPPLPMQPITLDLSDANYTVLAKAGGAVKIPNPHDAKKPIIVSRVSDGEAAAFSSKCTHLGCEVPLPENNVITCPCHGSKFDASGKVTHGPAGKNLMQFSATISGNTLTIKDIES
jgi:Rieske Fe-S protein